jgi:O-antigen/teichoic acid export membrane protein/CelD/BcsL family acetyltransferase involved in cellulose biosynthesis
MQRMASGAFMLRVINAGIAFLSQILLARWMGGYEYGIYIYVWTWLLVLGGTAGFGLSSAAPKFIPEYIERGDLDGLRGFLRGGRLFAVLTASLVLLAGCLALFGFGAYLPSEQLLPLYIGLCCLPMFVLTEVQDGIARSYNWVDVALAPAYFVRPILILVCIAILHISGFPSTAIWVLTASLAVVWVTALWQMRVLNNRLAVRVEKGKARYEVRNWLAIALPIFMVDGFYLLLTYCDIIILNHYVTPDKVAIYSVATKIMAIVAFVYFAVSAASTHRFTEYAARGDREQLALLVRKTVKWTFWPSLLATAGLLLTGHYILLMFGTTFISGYYLLPMLAIGLLARAGVGPIERVLSMMGEQKITAAIYACSFLLNVLLNIILIPYFELMGAAMATSTALCAESIMLFMATRNRLGINVFSFAAPAATACNARPGITVESLSATGMEQHTDAWKRLARNAAEANIYYDPAFAVPALRYLPHYKDLTFYAVWRNVESGKHMIGLIAARRSRWRWGIPIRVLAGWQPYAPLGLPLLDSTYGESAAHALLGHLRQCGAFLHIPFITEEGATAAHLRNAAQIHGQNIARINPHQRAVLTLSSAQMPHAKRSRHNIERLQRRMGSLGEVKLTIASAHEDVLPALETFLQLEATGWKRNRGALLTQENLTRFIRAATHELALHHQVWIGILTCGKTAVAAGIVFQSNHQAWYFKTAYHEGWSQFSPGVQVSYHLTQTLLSNPDIQLSDSIATADHSMINRLWPERMDIADWLIELRPENAMLFQGAVWLERKRLHARQILSRWRSKLKTIPSLCKGED